MEHGERIAEVNRLLTSGDKMSQKKIAALPRLISRKTATGQLECCGCSGRRLICDSATLQSSTDQLCVNGHKKSYCGYVWSRVEI